MEEKKIIKAKEERKQLIIPEIQSLLELKSSSTEFKI